MKNYWFHTVLWSNPWATYHHLIQLIFSWSFSILVDLEDLNIEFNGIDVRRLWPYLWYVSLFMQDIVNFEMFSSHLTNDEQQQLMKLLPSVDALDAPYRCVLQLLSYSLQKSSMDNISISKIFLSYGTFSNSRERNTEILIWVPTLLF